MFLHAGKTSFFKLDTIKFMNQQVGTPRSRPQGTRSLGLRTRQPGQSARFAQDCPCCGRTASLWLRKLLEFQKTLKGQLPQLNNLLTLICYFFKFAHTHTHIHKAIYLQTYDEWLAFWIFFFLFYFLLNKFGF